MRRLRANAAPCIVPYEDLPAAARVRLPGVEELGSRAAYIREDGDLRERLLSTESPEVMPADGLTGYRADVARRLLAEKGTVPWLTLPRQFGRRASF